MSLQNIIIECMDILCLQNKPIESFLELSNIDLIGSLLQLINNKNDITSSIDRLSTEVQCLFEEHFSSKHLIDIELAISGNIVELRILYLLLIYISLLTNANLRSKLCSSSMISSTEVKLTYLMERIQEKSSLSRQDLEILVQKNLDFLSESPAKNICYSPQLRETISSNTYQSPLNEYLQSPSFKYQKKYDEKNREIKNLRQQIYNLESEKQDLQDDNMSLTKKKERAELERNKISNELKSLMSEYEESTNSALIDEKEDKKTVLDCHKKIRILEAENKSVLLECGNVTRENNECLQKVKYTQSQLNTVTKERDSLVKSVESLQEACTTNDALLEEQSSELIEIKTQLEELKRWFQEQKSKTTNETFENQLTLNGTQGFSISNVEGESMITTFGEDSRQRLEEVELEMSSKNKIIKELTNECQQLSAQLTSIEKKFSEKETYCVDLLVANENLTSQLNTVNKKSPVIQQKDLSDMYESVNKLEYDAIVSKNKSLLIQIDNFIIENKCQLANLSQMEEGKEKLLHKIEIVENLNAERGVKYEKLLEENRSLLEKIIHIKDEKEAIQICLNAFKEEKYNTTNKHNNIEDKMIALASQNDRLEKTCENLHNNILKKDDQLQVEQNKICELKEENLKLIKEVQNYCQKLSLCGDGSVDVQKQVLSAKEDALKIESDLQRTIDDLKKELELSKETISSDKKTIVKLKTSFKHEMEKMIQQVGELESIEKDNEILKQKYDSSKKNLLNCKNQLESVTSSNKSMEIELRSVKSELLGYKKVQRQSSATLQRFQDEKQPLELKLVEVEEKLKLVITERNSLNAQLQMAESSLRNMKKDEMRGSFVTRETLYLHRNPQRRLTTVGSNVRINVDNENMEAPPPPKKPLLRAHSMALREPKSVLKKTTSQFIFPAGHHSNDGLTRRKSVSSRMSDYNFAVNNAIPHTLSTINDEEDGHFVDGNLAAIEDDSLDWRRMSELQRRNSLYPPHMRSDYTTEMQYKSVPYSEDNFRSGEVDRLSVANYNSNAYNLRKRPFQSSSTPNDRKSIRLTDGYSTSYLPKNECWDIPVDTMDKMPATYSKSPKILKETRHGLSPSSKVRRTPSNLSRILKNGKSPWKKLHDKKEDEPSSSEGSRKRIFRNPFGSKDYNVRSAALKHESQSS